MNPTATALDTLSSDADLAIGAVAIARDCFDNKIPPRKVYRLAEQGWPIFDLDHRRKAARRSAIKAEMARREDERRNPSQTADGSRETAR
jgi:hypothetical protein